MNQKPAPDLNPSGKTLVMRVSDALREQIQEGRYALNDKLPSEAQLTREFGVSRTVVREAVATLRSEGIVASRQGAGVFITQLPPQEELPFASLDTHRVSSLIELLEFRAAVEGDAAALAALRRSPTQEEKIIEALEALRRAARAGQPTSEADFQFHLAIAEAANNPRFAQFLQMIGPGLIPRRSVSDDGEPPLSVKYQDMLDAEHEAILIAIQNADEEGARQAMREHLKNSQARYRLFLRERRSARAG